MWRDAEPVAQAPPSPPGPPPPPDDILVGTRCPACGVRKVYLGEGMGYMDRGYGLLHERQCVGRPVMSIPSASDADGIR